MDRWLGKTAVVTGAASGMGKAITRALLQNGVNVVALDVQKERLAELDVECKREKLPGTLHTRRCDVSREDEIDAAFSHIETLGGVDIMVNNAGVCEFTRIIESDRKSLEKILNTNLLAYAVCIGKAVRSMRKRNAEGHVFNINSVLGHYLFMDKSEKLANCNIYSASKHGSVALTHEVRRELAQIEAPIRITSISPGIVKTNITKHSEKMKDFFDKTPHILPKDIAHALIYALGLQSHVQITELTVQHVGELP